MTRELELRLVGHAAGDGELVAGDAIAIIGAVKELVYRVTRAVSDRAGLGRADAMVERLAEVRVALRGQGSRLVFTIGDTDAFDIDPNGPEVDDTLWRIVRGMAGNRRPSGVSDSVAEAVDQLVVALWKAADAAEVVAPRRKPLLLTTRRLDRRPWQRRPAPASVATMHGTLEMVDLHTGRFRLRDPDGTAVDLIEVPDAPLVAHLVGKRVAASGVLARGSATRHHRMEQATVSEPAPVEEPVRVLPGQEVFVLEGLDPDVADAAPRPAGRPSTADDGEAATMLDAPAPDAAPVAAPGAALESDAPKDADPVLLDLPAAAPARAPQRPPRRRDPRPAVGEELLLDL